jgi:hypothetical protein
MIKRLLWLRVVLLSVTGLITCWFAVQAIGEGWTYLRLDRHVPARVQKWDIKMISSSNYALHAAYRYSVNGQEFTGETLLSSPRYPNHYAAEIDLKTRRSEQISVWYQKNHPAFSSLQKRFPRKEFTNAILTFGVFIYFYFARGLLSDKERL